MTAYQQGKPVHWIMPEEVTLPSGRRLTGTKAKVYEVLRLAKETAHVFRVGQAYAPPGWVPVWVFREPWCGGSAGDRRLRELKRVGVALESKQFNPGGTSPDSLSWIWRLKDGCEQAGASPGARSRRSVNQAPAGSSTPQPGSLQGVTIHLRLERPTLWVGQLVDISPGLHHLAAPPAALCQQVLRRELEPEQARTEYRRQLVPLYETGALARLFQPAGSPRVLTVCCEAPFPALAVLQRALAALGAAVVPDEEDSAA